MIDQTSLARRAVVRTIGSIAGGTIAVSTTAAGSRSGTDADRTPWTNDAQTAANSDGTTQTVANPDSTTQTTVNSDDTTQTTANSDRVTRYVAVVDRIVDETHVVLLLEKDGDLVDQHVAPAVKMDDVEETDILHVVIEDGEVLAYQHLDKRPGDPATPDFSDDR